MTNKATAELRAESNGSELPESSNEQRDPPIRRAPITNPKAGKKTVKKVVTQTLRRAHLYLGLFLFPWAILYGFTGYLFNHPIAFRNPPAVPFGSEVISGTPFEHIPSPQQQAQEVVAKLNELQQPATPYKLVGEAGYEGRENVLALIKTDGPKNVSVSIHVRYREGLTHYETKREPKPVEKAPFNVGPPVAGARARGGEGGGPPPGARNAGGAGIMLEDTIQKRLIETVPTVLERTNFPS